MSRFHKLALAACVAFVGLPFHGFADDAKDAVVAKIGKAEITQSELDLAVANLDPQLAQLPDEQKKIAALSGAIDVKLLAASAEAEGIQDTAEFKKRLQYIADRELHNAYFKKHVADAVTDAEVKARYDQEIASLPKQDEVRARHILVKTEEEAKAIIAELDAGKDFIELAKDKSTDPNKSEGGDLGYFSKGRMVPEFEAVVFDMPVGTYTKTPVKTQFGFHVIKVEDKRVAPAPAYADVEPQVKQLVMRDKYLALIAGAKEKSTIEIVDPALAKGYEDVNKKP